MLYDDKSPKKRQRKENNNDKASNNVDHIEEENKSHEDMVYTCADEDNFKVKEGEQS